ncbi:TPA: hypothetical protein L1241_004154 [Escherichia coli]|nr:hypothetical protein [Escherichia coli]HBN1784507.1 hypothetical protein [Escherichia coli]HBN2121930.1 hypothetical protein [Escherichia coli]HBN2126188.1 hypothetical protein [Escherichia coli]
MKKKLSSEINDLHYYRRQLIGRNSRIFSGVNNN